jgi:hypothetical protein
MLLNRRRTRVFWTVIAGIVTSARAGRSAPTMPWIVRKISRRRAASTSVAAQPPLSQQLGLPVRDVDHRGPAGRAPGVLPDRRNPAWPLRRVSYRPSPRRTRHRAARRDGAVRAAGTAEGARCRMRTRRTSTMGGRSGQDPAARPTTRERTAPPARHQTLTVGDDQNARRGAASRAAEGTMPSRQVLVRSRPPGRCGLLRSSMRAVRTARRHQTRTGQILAILQPQQGYSHQDCTQHGMRVKAPRLALAFRLKAAITTDIPQG